MNDTGFPSPFIDIMMLRPALRTSQMSFCSLGSVTSTTLPGRPRSPIELDEPRELRELRVAIVTARTRRAGSLSGAPRTKRATMGANAPLPRASPIIVLSTSSTASGSSLTMCCVHFHRPAEGREVADAERLVARDRRELQRSAAASRRACLRSRRAGAPGCAAACRRWRPPGRAAPCRCCSPATRRRTFGQRAAISAASRRTIAWMLLDQRRGSPAARSRVSSLGPKR